MQQIKSATCVELQSKLKNFQQAFLKIKTEALKFSGNFANTSDIQNLTLLLEAGQKLENEVKKLDLELKLGNLREVLAQDYEENAATLQSFEKTDKEGNQLGPLIEESRENPGRYEYRGDYDGTEELKNGQKVQGENFTGQTFIMPTLDEIFASLTFKQLNLYKEMKKQGLEPKLQLTPLAYTIKTLARAIDSRKGEISILKDKTYVWDGIQDHELMYEPETIEAIEKGIKVKITGGMTKSGLIKKYQGWMVEFVCDQQDVAADPDLLKDSRTGESLTIGQQLSGYHKKGREKGMSGLGYENELVAQMRGLKKLPPRPLEMEKGKEIFNILPESCLIDSKLVAGGFWRGNQVYLYRNYARNRYDSLRCRRSVRVLKI